MVGVMHLFVVRHAIAEEAKPGKDDAARPLAPEGVRKFKRAVLGLRELRWTFSRVLTSPWTRAIETAKLLAPITDGEITATELLCDKPRSELLALIAEQSGAPKEAIATAVVGHEPWLSELVSWLAFGDSRHAEAFELKKGSIVWLEGAPTPGGMHLRAILPPKVLRELAG
jgi:phosphohistidine phosphatase